ncbi:MAG: CDGSH iron-sulfur domain-containing protein, partial [Candidatus Rokubacteria bacterium]|nr:CDGSH iron-sulfur domain-containing protein [Candidatus Rokubacteria bacterium]
VTGECQVTDAEGNAVVPNANPFYLCRCGASANKPFCDGQHKKIEFKS